MLRPERRANALLPRSPQFLKARPSLTPCPQAGLRTTEVRAPNDIMLRSAGCKKYSTVPHPTPAESAEAELRQRFDTQSLAKELSLLTALLYARRSRSCPLSTVYGERGGT